MPLSVRSFYITEHPIYLLQVLSQGLYLVPGNTWVDRRRRHSLGGKNFGSKLIGIFFHIGFVHSLVYRRKMGMFIFVRARLQCPLTSLIQGGIAMTYLFTWFVVPRPERKLYNLLFSTVSCTQISCAPLRDHKWPDAAINSRSS